MSQMSHLELVGRPTSLILHKITRQFRKKKYEYMEKKMNLATKTALASLLIQGKSKSEFSVRSSEFH